MTFQENFFLILYPLLFINFFFFLGGGGALILTGQSLINLIIVHWVILEDIAKNRRINRIL